MTHGSILRVCVVAALVLFVCGSALGQGGSSGPYLLEEGTRDQGASGAGAGAKVKGDGTASTNSAGTTWLEHGKSLAAAQADRMRAKPKLDAASIVSAGPVGSAPNRWRFQLTPYAWLPSMRGSVTVLGMKQPVKLTLGDLFAMVDELEAVVPFQFQASYNRWKFWLDVQYLQMSDSMRQTITRSTAGVPIALNATINAKVGVKMQMLLTEFGVDYELLKLPLGKEKKSALRFDLRAGGRYVYMKSELDISAQVAGTIVGPRNVIPFSGGLNTDSGGSRQWLEPLFGAAVWWDVNDRLRLMLRGDIGGFGIGSDLSWQVVGGVEWDVCDWVAIFAGYRLLDIDFVEGSGPRRFAFDVQMQGPYIAAMFRF